MTALTPATVLAMAALVSAAGAGWASTGTGQDITAQAATPLELPAAPTPLPADAGDGSAKEPDGGSGMDTSPVDEDDGDIPEGELSLGEIPVIETVELTPETARRALDSYIAAREKYVNSDLESYENLQDFVDQTEEGKAFEADIKAAGFASVNDWNLAVTTLSLTYGSLIDDQSSDIMMQVKEVEDDTEMAQDIKDRMIKALKALVPSANNSSVVNALMDDPVYGEKLKLLDIEDE